jgi:hypothetical protein
MDGDVVWSQWNTDITSTQAFETFCLEKPHLRILLFDSKEAKKRISNMCKLSMKPHGDFFFNLAFWPHWFYGFDKSFDVYHLLYLTPIHYEDFSGTGSKKITAFLQVFNVYLVLDNYQVLAYGSYESCPINAVLVNKVFLKKHPELLADGGPTVATVDFGGGTEH